MNEELELENTDNVNEIYQEVKKYPRQPLYYLYDNFEPYYELIKTDPNAVWEMYEENILKTMRTIGYYRNVPHIDYISDIYIFFIEKCKVYDPYYNDKFYPFDRFIFYNLIIKMRAIIQRQYFIMKREVASDSDANHEGMGIFDKASYNEDYTHMNIEAFFNELPDVKWKTVARMVYEGYSQMEIQKEVGISQSRVSIMIQRLREVILNSKEDVSIKKKKVKSNRSSLDTALTKAASNLNYQKAKSIAVTKPCNRKLIERGDK